jgi:hypothetical protein
MREKVFISAFNKFSTSDGKECSQMKHEIKSNNLSLVDQAATLLETN